MINNKNRVFRFILLLLTAVIAMSSCGIITINRPDKITEPTTDDQGETVTDNSETTAKVTTSDNSVIPIAPPDNQKAAKKYLDALTSRDLKGVGMVISTTDNSLFTPDNDGTPAVTARLLRNRAVETKYNTIIMTNVCASIDVMLSEAKQSLNSGMYYADLLAVPSLNLGAFKAQNLLFNLNSLPFTDYTAPYYNFDAMRQMSGGYSIYGAAGELTENMEDMYLMFFNKTILEKYDIENPYLLVEDGKWTWDKMREMIITVNDNINSNGDTPITGHAAQTDTDTYIDIMFASTGQHYMTAGVGIIPTVSFNTTNTNKLIETARNLLFKDGTYLDADDNDNTAMTSFYNGSLLFYVNRLFASSWFINMKDSWGILPIPKLNMAQGNYYTYFDKSIPVMAVLASGVGVEKIGLLMQALNAASYKYINDTYYTHLSNNVFRDNGSINMLDYVRRYPRYDFAYMFGSDYSYIPDGTYNLLRKSIKKGTALEPAYSSYLPLINKQMAKAFEMLGK
ncbi:MAG: hypothetical protein ACYCWE_12825 [Eubacteriales bacterium]